MGTCCAGNALRRSAAPAKRRPGWVLAGLFALAFGLGAADPAVAAVTDKKPARAPAAQKSVKRKAKAAKRKKPRPKRSREAARTESKAKGRAAEPAAEAEAKRAKAAKPGSDEVVTHSFDAQHIEGRLRSPQILYFLRRVRAQFDPRPLGHRSFLLELQDTGRSAFDR